MTLSDEHDADECCSVRMDSRPSSVVTVYGSNDTAISKKAAVSGFHQSLEIDWNAPHVHEVQEFFKLLGDYPNNKDMSAVVCKNLWALVCCLARDAVTTQQETQHQ